MGRRESRSDPGQVAGHRAVENKRVHVVGCSHIPSYVSHEIGLNAVQINRRELVSSAAGNVVVPQHQAVGVLQMDAKAVRVRDVVIGDPNWMAAQDFSEDGIRSGLLELDATDANCCVESH